MTSFSWRSAGTSSRKRRAPSSIRSFVSDDKSGEGYPSVLEGLGGVLARSPAGVRIDTMGWGHCAGGARVSLAAAAATATLALLSAAPAQATFPGGNGKLAFASCGP